MRNQSMLSSLHQQCFSHAIDVYNQFFKAILNLHKIVRFTAISSSFVSIEQGGSNL